MKKKDAVSIMLIVLLMLISCGCQPPSKASSNASDVFSENSNISESVNESGIEPLFAAIGCNTDDDYAAITHLGYDLSDELVLDAIANRIKGVNISEISNNIERVKLNGNEFYLIIPKYKDSVITVYRANEDEIYDEASPIGVYYKPIVINCNESDIISNAVVKIEYNNSDGSMSAITVTPFLSLMDGSICDTEHFFEFWSF